MEFGIQIQYDDHFDTALKAAANAGFHNVSLGFGSSKCFHETNWEQHLIRIEKLLSANALRCIQTHTPYYDLLISAEKTDDAMDKAMLRCIEATGKLGAAWTAYHPRTAITENCSSQKSLEYAKRAIAPLADTAVKFNTGVAIENLPVWPIDSLYEFKFFGSNYDELCQLHDYFNTAEIGICWDFGHAHLMRWSDEALAIKTLGNRIKATHIHSNMQRDDDHLPPLLGNTNWSALMPALSKVYTGALMLELNYTCNHALESFFRYNLESLKVLEDFV